MFQKIGKAFVAFQNFGKIGPCKLGILTHTQGKFDLAACAKKNGLDAIHDTVHEMAKDEARHGKALKGLLERYFK